MTFRPRDWLFAAALVVAVTHARAINPQMTSVRTPFALSHGSRSLLTNALPLHLGK